MRLPKKELMTMTKQFNNVYGENGEYQLRDRMMDQIRKVPELDSMKGVRVYDIDGFIWNISPKKGTTTTLCNAFIIENKTYLSEPKPHQILTLSKIDKSFSNSDEFTFKGTYLIQFENTGPDDGFTTISKMDNGYFKKMKSVNTSYQFWQWIEEMLFDTITIKEPIDEVDDDFFKPTPKQEPVKLKNNDPRFNNQKIIDDIL